MDAGGRATQEQLPRSTQSGEGKWETAALPPTENGQLTTPTAVNRKESTAHRETGSHLTRHTTHTLSNR
jgi:hypothetical protein